MKTDFYIYKHLGLLLLIFRYGKFFTYVFVAVEFPLVFFIENLKKVLVRIASVVDDPLLVFVVNEYEHVQVTKQR